MTTNQETKTTRRKFIALVGGGTVAAATLGATAISFGDTMPAEALVAWNGAEASGDPRLWMVSYAILAPNPHNLQAWRVDLSVPDEITIFCDLSRLLPETDPFNRQVLIGHGAFLELLTIAAAERGYRAKIGLFPTGVPKANVDARPVAHVRLTKDAEVPKDSLFSRIAERRTNRQPYDAKRPATTPELRDLLAFAGT